MRRTLTSSSRSRYDELDVVLAARAAGVTVTEPAVPADRWVAANGARLHLLDWGNGHLPPLLFLHGFAQQAHSWDFASLALRHEFHVLVLDFRGHGDSEWSKDGVYSLEQHVADVGVVIAALGLERPVVCGLSMGGRAAYLHAARAGREVRGLIVAEAAPETAPSARRVVTSFTSSFSGPMEFEAIVAKVMSYNPRRSANAVRGSLRNNLRQLPDGLWTWKYDPAIRDARNHAADGASTQWPALAAVLAPTLFVIGSESEMIERRTVERMLSTVPDSRAAYVPDAGHLVAGDNPAGFDRAIRGFLKGLGGAAGDKLRESKGD
jgi:pimeloyl-ACP methyl ester carboxylesterase